MGFYPFVVLSGSMEPKVHTGAVAYINLNDTNVQPGDIVMYQTGESIYVIHRIKEIDSNGLYVMKGDANENVDFIPVSQEKIRGKFMFSIPGLGYLISKIKRVHVVIGVIWVVILHLLAAWFNKLAADEEKARNRRYDGEDDDEDDEDDDYDYEN
jgi:signal peptidase